MQDELKKLKDTIVSVATFPAQAAIGVIKLSGDKSLDIVEKMFRAKAEKDLRKVDTYTMHYGWIVDANKTKKNEISESRIDEVIVAVMRGPKSHTCEDVVEIYTHSGQFVLNKIMELCLKHGARLAEAGEFTKRAFLNGRIDLVQAEAVNDVIAATTDESLRLGVGQLAGKLSLVIDELLEHLEFISVHMEADISFPEDVEIDLDPVLERCKESRAMIKDLLRYSDKARLFRDGARCVICGKTNVGKSSLLNMLLEEERVIVTNIKGTTRDVIEESINIKGLPLKIYDTAGILNPRDMIEEKAIDKSYQKIEEADIILYVVDISRKLSKEDKLILKRIAAKKVLVVYNKADLAPKVEKEQIESYGFPSVSIAAKDHKGLKDLEKAIIKTVGSGVLPKNRDVYVSNIRHIDLLKKAELSLKEAEYNLKKNVMLDIAYFKAREACEFVSSIVGKGVAVDVLNNVFDNFCIGK